MKALIAAGLAALLAGSASDAAATWRPERPVEIVVPAGPGGGSDQLARLIQSIVARHTLLNQSISVVNKPGANSATGVLDVARAQGDPHKLLVALSNLYIIELTTDLNFRWSDMTPIAILAFDDFILWSHADRPEQTVQDLIAAARASPQPWLVGGTQSRNDDHILTVALQRTTGARFSYVPYRGGAEVTTQLVGRHIALNVNNPGESIAAWRANQVRPHCVFSSQRIAYTRPIASGRSWNDIPTCRESGLDLEFKVLRVIMAPAGLTAEQRQAYVTLLEQVTKTDEWKAYAEENALQQVFLTGDQAIEYMTRDHAYYTRLMREAGFLHPSRQ